MGLHTHTLPTHWENPSVPNTSQIQSTTQRSLGSWGTLQRIDGLREEIVFFCLASGAQWCFAEPGAGIFPAAVRATHSPVPWPDISNLSCACFGIVWGDPEPTPGEVDDDLGYKKTWKTSCSPSPSWRAQPQAAWLAPAAEGKVKVWEEVAAPGDRGTKAPKHLSLPSPLLVPIWPGAASSSVWIAHPRWPPTEALLDLLPDLQD